MSFSLNAPRLPPDTPLHLENDDMNATATKTDQSAEQVDDQAREWLEDKFHFIPGTQSFTDRDMVTAYRAGFAAGLGHARKVFMGNDELVKDTTGKAPRYKDTTGTQPDRPRLRRTEVPAYMFERHGIPVALATLNKLASTGGGPEMQYAGRIPLYTPEALDAWAAARLSTPVSSTSRVPA
jgi:hypothetical protein